MGKPIIGLTGGIACGKSTIASYFRDLGIAIVDADLLARDVVQQGTEVLDAIIETFGSEILDSDGNLDRKRLGKVVFQDEEARKKLNAITHPAIAKASAEALQAALAGPSPYAIYEAALLIENRIHDGFRPLIVVTVDAKVQLERLMMRDGISEQDARARIESQLPLEEKMRLADHIIDNSGSAEDSRQRVEALHRLWEQTP